MGIGTVGDFSPARGRRKNRCFLACNVFLWLLVCLLVRCLTYKALSTMSLYCCTPGCTLHLSIQLLLHHPWHETFPTQWLRHIEEEKRRQTLPRPATHHTIQGTTFWNLQSNFYRHRRTAVNFDWGFMFACLAVQVILCMWCQGRISGCCRRCCRWH